MIRRNENLGLHDVRSRIDQNKGDQKKDSNRPGLLEDIDCFGVVVELENHLARGRRGGFRRRLQRLGWPNFRCTAVGRRVCSQSLHTLTSANASSNTRKAKSASSVVIVSGGA